MDISIAVGEILDVVIVRHHFPIHLHVSLSVIIDDANFSVAQGLAFLHKDHLPVMIGRFHAVSIDPDCEVGSVRHDFLRVHDFFKIVIGQKILANTGGDGQNRRHYGNFPEHGPCVGVSLLALKVLDIPPRQAPAFRIQRRRDRRDMACEKIQSFFDTQRMADCQQLVGVRDGNIIFLERPVHNGDIFSRRHPKMTNRAKIFAPFAALIGFDDRVKRKEIDYTARRELAEGETVKLNAVLNRLARGDRVKVRYFELCSDHENDAFGRLGLYKTASGCVRWVDAVGQVLYLEDKAIGFSDLYRLEIE